MDSSTPSRKPPITQPRGLLSPPIIAPEKPFRPTDVAEPICVFILDYFAYELRAALAEPFKRLVDVVHGKHDAEVAQGVHRGVAVIRDDGRREEAGELEPAVAVRCAHHGNLDALIAQSGHTSGPFSFDGRPPFELETELPKKIDRPPEVFGAREKWTRFAFQK